MNHVKITPAMVDAAKKALRTVYSTERLAAMETYLRQRYSGCLVEQLKCRTVVTSPWTASAEREAPR